MSVYKHIRPLGDRLVVLPIKPQEQRNGIIIPPIKNPESQTPIQSAVIIAKSHMITELHQGDMILFESTAGIEVQVDDAKMRIIRLTNVQAEI